MARRGNGIALGGSRSVASGHRGQWVQRVLGALARLDPPDLLVQVVTVLGVQELLGQLAQQVRSLRLLDQPVLLAQPALRLPSPGRLALRQRSPGRPALRLPSPGRPALLPSSPGQPVRHQQLLDQLDRPV